MESLPANLLIFPLIGGYYITTRLEHSKYIGQRKSSQGVLFDAVLVAIPLLAGSLFINTVTTYLLPEQVSFLKQRIFPIQDEFFGTCLLSSIIAYVFVKVANWFSDETKAIFKAIEIVGNELEVLFLSSCRDSELIQITLKNNKVYIGWVETISKPSQNQFIRLLPLFSGYRHDISKELEITTDYSTVYSDLIRRGKVKAIRQADVNLVINSGEILTASKFDFNYFERFVLERKERNSG